MYYCIHTERAEGGFDVDEVTFIISVVVSALGSSLITGLITTIIFLLCKRRSPLTQVSTERAREMERVYEDIADCVMTYNNEVYQKTNDTPCS